MHFNVHKLSVQQFLSTLLIFLIPRIYMYWKVKQFCFLLDEPNKKRNRKRKNRDEDEASNATSKVISLCSIETNLTLIVVFYLVTIPDNQNSEDFDPLSETLRHASDIMHPGTHCNVFRCTVPCIQFVQLEQS